MLLNSSQALVSDGVDWCFYVFQSSNVTHSIILSIIKKLQLVSLKIISLIEYLFTNISPHMCQLSIFYLAVKTTFNFLSQTNFPHVCYYIITFLVQGVTSHPHCFKIIFILSTPF